MIKNRYTSEDNQIILRKIQENPGNLQAVFEELSKEIPHSKESISVHWYRKLSKENGVCFLVCGSRRAHINRKSVHKEDIASKVIIELPWYKRFWNKLTSL